MAWKILITDGLEQTGKDILNEKGEAVDRKGVEAAELLQIVSEYDALIVRGRTKVTKEVIAAGKNLKVIGRAGVGVDNIDLEAAQASHVTVVNCPVATSEAVAELAMGMLFCLAREIPRADALMKANKWAKKDFEGIELMDKTLGVIGYGNIGRRLGKYAGAMGMKVLANDEYRDAAYIQENGAQACTLDEIYAQSDFISIHVPLTAESRHMISDDAFAKMKTGVRIVDAARGGIIEEAALLRALGSGKVAGVALDVYENEPPTDWTLIENSHVVAMPHVGAQTQEAQLRAAIDIASEVINCLDGKPLRWKIV